MPSFCLVIVDPKPTSSFVGRLRNQRDQRVWIVSGPEPGTFAGFVGHLLPDLRDEEILKKVMATYRALGEGVEADESKIQEPSDGE